MALEYADAITDTRRDVDDELYQRGRPPRARYLFKHALIQDAAYASLLRSARQQVHANVAQALMDKLPELAETQPELLAHHYTQAGLLAPALDRWQAAVERAVQRSAYVEAIHSIDQALAQLAQLPPDEARDRRELDLQAMKLGPLQPGKGYSSPEIDAASGRALALCRSLGDRAKLFPVLYGRWAIQFVAGRYREGFVLSRELPGGGARVRRRRGLDRRTATPRRRAVYAGRRGKGRAGSRVSPCSSTFRSGTGR